MGVVLNSVGLFQGCVPTLAGSQLGLQGGWPRCQKQMASHSAAILLCHHPALLRLPAPLGSLVAPAHLEQPLAMSLIRNTG